MKPIIGVDVDGVLANFNAGYRQRLIEVTGRNLIPIEDCRGAAPGEEPPCWDYAPHYGYTRDEDKRTWASITNDPRFWLNLAPLPEGEPFLQALQHAVLLRNGEVEVYFITSRPGVLVKMQTELWLRRAGWSLPRTVLIARGDKSGIAKGLGLTHFLDDRPENCIGVDVNTDAAVYMPSCRYNEAPLPGGVQVKRISSLFEFIKDVFCEQPV